MCRQKVLVPASDERAARSHTHRRDEGRAVNSQKHATACVGQGAGGPASDKRAARSHTHRRDEGRAVNSQKHATAQKLPPSQL